MRANIFPVNYRENILDTFVYSDKITIENFRSIKQTVIAITMLKLLIYAGFLVVKFLLLNFEPILVFKAINESLVKFMKKIAISVA